MYFNPLPPHGGRLTSLLLPLKALLFQSTPSAWRETRDRYNLAEAKKISIHSLRMEGDVLFPHLVRRSTHFNPLPPHGVRPLKALLNDSPIFPFQSTPSAWRETAKLHRKAFFISPILVQSCKKGCKRLHSAPEKMVFFEKREKNLVRNLQHLSVRL